MTCTKIKRTADEFRWLCEIEDEARGSRTQQGIADLYDIHRPNLPPKLAALGFKIDRVAGVRCLVDVVYGEPFAELVKRDAFHIEG